MELTKFNEIVQKLKRISDADGIQELDNIQKTINSTWNQSSLKLQQEKTKQEKLITIWNKFNFDVASAEKQYLEIEEQSNRIDSTVRSKELLKESINQTQVNSKSIRP